ncbi:MAG: MFS transporter [Desulfobacterales bacterium]|nr:MFS transporter [Desulfobacterales bacterium]
MRITESTNVRVIFALTLVHFTGDLYSSFISPLFPLFVEKMGLSLAQVGIVAGVARLLAFIVQPSVGYLADRYQTRGFILGGLLMSVVFIPLSGVAPAFWVLLALVALGSVGSSMFHPSVTGMIPLHAGKNAAMSMSVFNTGGTLAFALGPVFITWYAAAFGLEAVPITMVFGLAVLIYLYFAVPQPESEGFKELGFLGSLKRSLGHAWRPILLIWAVMMLRAVVGQSFLTFIPVLYVNRGYSLVSAGMLFSLFTLAGTASGLLAGFFSDRIGYKPVFVISHTLMTPALLILLALPGGWVYPGAALAGFFTLASLPIGVVMAQTLAPRGRSMVASLMMGFAYGLGGAFSPLVGKLADVFSIQPVLFAVAFIPLITLLPIRFFPDVGGKRADSRPA